jgi:alkyl sulfatase BDS1-like metallo-beta-lactamase superfamily hydrolase
VHSLGKGVLFLAPYFKSEIVNLFKLLIIASMVYTVQSNANELSSKAASEATLAYQQKIKNALPFADVKDFELAEKGLIKRPEKVEIFDASGQLVWELGNYDY